MAVAVIGLPTFSVGRHSTWRTILADEGFRYSSSVYPIAHDLYGSPAAPRRLRTTVRIDRNSFDDDSTIRSRFSDGGRWLFPVSPYRLSRSLLREPIRQRCARCLLPSSLGNRSGAAPPMPLRSRFRHYINLSGPKPGCGVFCTIFGGREWTGCFYDGSSPPIGRFMDGSLIAVAVTRFRAGDDGRWDAFVQARADSSFFHLSGWRRVIEPAFRHRTYYLMAERDGAVTGVLPLTQVKSRLFGSCLISNAFCVQGGPIARRAA